MTEEWMTVTEIAARWRVSRMTVYRLVEDGSLPSIRIGKQIRVTRRDVLAYEHL
jgi:excisionase family DNA binding protein